MEKTITTAILAIAGIIATVALINAILPAASKGSGALTGANNAAANRIKTDIELVFATGETTGDTITFWAKNVGVSTIAAIKESDIFLTTPSTITRVPYDGGGSPTIPYWVYTIEQGQTDWLQAGTVKVTLYLNSVTTGLHKVSMTVHNGASAQKEFSI